MIRAAVLYFCKPSARRSVAGLAEALAQGLKKQGAQVDVIDGIKERDIKLTGYHYLAVGCDVRSILKGVVPPELASSLSHAGIVAGKKTFAFVHAAPLGASATLLRLMKALEHEGMVVRYSEVLAKPADALAVGQRLKVE